MSTGKAWVLTSVECLKALKEKKNKKSWRKGATETRKVDEEAVKEEELKCTQEEKAQKAELIEA